MSIQQRTNIVLIATDQWRGDCLSLQGHPVMENSTQVKGRDPQTIPYPGPVRFQTRSD